MARISLNEVGNRPSTVDQAKLAATTEEDIRRYKAEDGYRDLQPPASVHVVSPPKELRMRLGLTQQEIADALRIPVGTWRNWEQGRVALDPAARSLLAIVQADPAAAFSALATGA